MSVSAFSMFLVLEFVSRLAKTTYIKPCFFPIAEGCTLRSAQSTMKNITNERVGSEVQYGPRLVGDILSEMLSSDSPLAMGYRQHLASKKSDAEKGGRV